MEILTIIASIYALTLAVWLWNKIAAPRLGSGTKFRICPICAGVSATWLWVIAGVYLGLLKDANWPMAAAVLMGGSVVGIAYQAERKLFTGLNEGGVLLWKVLFIPAGFAIAYSAVTFAIAYAAVGVGLLALEFAAFWAYSKRAAAADPERVRQLEERMKNCC